MEASHPLKSFRVGRGLSRAEMADLLKVSVPTYFRWETGERQPDEKRLPFISKVTGIPAKELRPDLVEKAEKLLGAA